MMIAWLFIFPAVVGLLLLMRGVRGRRVDIHPLCRACGYDLVASSGAATCPECGRDVTRPRAVRIGHRRRRVLPLAFGGLLLALSIGAGGVFGWAAAKGFDWNPYKPLWMLKREAGAGGTTPINIAVAAQNEILQRLATKRLSAVQVDAIIRESLAQQADLTVTWQPWRGDFIEAAWAGGIIGDDAIKPYLTNAVMASTHLEVTPRVRYGETLWIKLACKPFRCAGGGNGLFGMEITGKVIKIGDRVISMGGSSTMSLSAGSSGSSGTGMPCQERTPGRYPVVAEMRVRVGATAGMWQRNSVSDEESVEGAADSWALLDIPLRLEESVEVVDRHAPMPDDAASRAAKIRMIRDSAMEPAIRATIENTPQPEVYYSGMDLWSMECDIAIWRPPCDLAFDVILRDAEHLWTAGSFVALKGDALTTSVGGSIPKDCLWLLESKSVDVILRSSAAAAAMKEGVESIWDGEIVFPAATIKRRPPREG